MMQERARPLGGPDICWGRRNSRNLAAGNYSVFGKRADGYSKGLRQAANLKRRNVDSNAPLPEAPSEVPEAGGSDCVGPTAASSSDFGPIRFWSTRVKAPLQSLP